MKKFLLVMGLLTVVATPAFAQSFSPSYGTGNELPFAYASNAQTQKQTAARSTGEQSYAMSPREDVKQDPYSPADTGGGSEGYNWNLAHDF
jgi:opacity protein-like surface antigen